MTGVRTVCPAPCFDACALLAHAEEGVLRRVEADPAHRPTAGFLCARGERWPERVNHPERLTEPLLRKGERGSGRFEPVSWEAAIERIAKALKKVAKDPQALLHHSGKPDGSVMGQFGEAFLARFGGCSTLHGDLCNSAGMEALRLTFGAVRHHPWDQVGLSRMAVLWGKNPAVTSPHQMHVLREARKRGLYTVCIDPVATKTALECDLHVPIRPGTDGFFANSVAHILIEGGSYDRAFVEAQVHGFEDYRWMVRHYEPWKAAETCGIPEATVAEFARRYAGSKPTNFIVGYGAQRYRNGGQTVRAIAALQAITGNIGLRGGGLDFFQPSGFLARPLAFPPPAPPRIRPIGPVSSLGRAILNAQDPPVTAAILERANPMTQQPFSAAVHHALLRLDFLCVIDLFLTDTARRADLVLPTLSPFEETDIHPGWWHGALALRPKCAEPPGKARSGREIWRAIAKAMGHPTDPYDLSPEAALQQALPAGLSVARLRRQSFERHASDHVPFADGRYPTPSGRIELRCDAAELAWNVDPLPFYAPSKESQASDPERFSRLPLQLLTPKGEQRQLSQWGNDDALLALAPPVIRIHPEDALAREIADGETVRVHNDRGEHRLPARVDPAVRPGVVVIDSGGWISKLGFSANLWTHDGTSDMGHGAIYFDCLVQVSKPGGSLNPAKPETGL